MISLLRKVLSKAAPLKSTDELLPPPELQQFVGGDYERVGREFTGYLIDLCGLKPHDSVLDIGCGSGRMAAPLTRYLDASGSYRGFDVSPKAIAWCRENIARRFPNFEFTAVDVQNVPYNAAGKLKPAEFRFPYASGSFDVVFLASVFTHMFPQDIANYMSEIVRVLKPSGRCLSTFFLLNEESSDLIDRKQGALNFEYRGKGFRSINEKRPEDAIAYPEEFVMSLWTQAGMKLSQPVLHGSWCGRPRFLSFQDIVVTVKDASSSADENVSAGVAAR